MVVLVLTACPPGLRGHISRWLLEISPGVFCGRVSGRVRDRLWAQVVEMCKDGRAIMVFSCQGDQGLDFRVHRHDWDPVDFDGISLIRRPAEPSVEPAMRRGWSKASQNRRARKVK